MRSDWFIPMLQSWPAAQGMTREEATRCVTLVKVASISAGGRIVDAPGRADLAELQRFAVQRAHAALDRYARLKCKVRSFEQLLTDATPAAEIVGHLQEAIDFARARDGASRHLYARDTLYDEFLQWQATEAAGRALSDERFLARRVELLRDTDYVAGLKSLMDRATKSITIAVSIIVWDGTRTHPVAQLIDALRDAMDRGVRVEIYNNVSGIRAAAGVGLQVKETLARLAALGTRVVAADGGPMFHAKFVLIDERVTVIGSHNWSGKSLTSTAELSAVCESEALASALAHTLQRS